MLLSSQCLNEPGTLGGDPPPPGGVLGYDLGGYVRPGFPNLDLAFFKKIAFKMIPVLEIGKFLRF